MSLVEAWNLKCGKMPPQKGTEEYYEAMMNQAERIQEELDELKEAIRCEDDDEILDALVDIKVTADGANFLSGHDCINGFLAVMDNNDLKWSHDRDAVEGAVITTEKETGEDHVLVTAFYDGKEYHSVRRCSDDKICKMPNHPKVDLKPFLFRG